MSQSDLSLSAWAPPQSQLIPASEAASRAFDPTLPLTSAQVWGNLTAQQQERVNQALITLCCQIAAEVAQTARRATTNREGGDEQG